MVVSNVSCSEGSVCSVWVTVQLRELSILWSPVKGWWERLVQFGGYVIKVWWEFLIQLGGCLFRYDEYFWSSWKDVWFGGSGIRTHVIFKVKIPSTGKILFRGEWNPWRCIKQDSEPNRVPSSYSGPPNDFWLLDVMIRIAVAWFDRLLTAGRFVESLAELYDKLLLNWIRVLANCVVIWGESWTAVTMVMRVWFCCCVWGLWMLAVIAAMCFLSAWCVEMRW